MEEKYRIDPELNAVFKDYIDLVSLMIVET